MALELAGVKSNKSRSYSTSAATVSVHPLAGINEFSSGAKHAQKESVKRLPSKRGDRARGRSTAPSLRGVARTIIP